MIGLFGQIVQVRRVQEGVNVRAGAAAWDSHRPPQPPRTPILLTRHSLELVRSPVPKVATVVGGREGGREGVCSPRKHALVPILNSRLSQPPLPHTYQG